MSPKPIEFPIEGLSDGVVRLRLMSDADVDAVTAACQDPAIGRYTTIPVPYEERHARQWLIASKAGIVGGTEIATLAVGAEDGELLGSVGIHGIDPASGRCSAGYWVAPKVRRRGVASRALRLLARFAFETGGLSRIELWVEPENAASRAVAQAVGFRCEGLLRSFMPIRGSRRDMLMYSLLPEDPDRGAGARPGSYAGRR